MRQYAVRAIRPYRKPLADGEFLHFMVQQTRKTHRAAAVLFMLLAFAAALLAVWLCVRPRPQTPAASVPAPVSAGAPEASDAVFEEFFSCLARKDWTGADGCLTGGSLGLDGTPEDPTALRLWQAQRDAWRFVPAGEPTLSDGYLLARWKVSTLDYSTLPGAVRPLVNELLARAAEAASLKSEIYDENGEYRQELLMSSLDSALDTVLQDAGAFLTEREVAVRAEAVDGRWRIRPDAELLRALTGGAVSDETGGPAESYDGYVGNLLARSLEGLAEIPVVYRLPENTVVAPKPTKSGFGRSKKAADTAKVLAEAEPLLNGRKLIWSTDKKTVADRWINWYRDDSIFAITWRQQTGGMYLTFCEVVVSHPSQFRRYLADNSFNSRYRYTPTQMAKTVNAVVGISGDFYKYRKLGIVVYQGKLYRCETKKLDTCFVDSAGNLKFVRHGELKNEETVRRYIEENDIRFSLSFGPIMIENGKNVLPKSKYPVGQIHENYTRCSISQLGEGHYLVAVASLTRSNLPLKKLADELISLGVDNAYALDGGQTASIVINGKLANPVDFGEERMMSDILYFATAIPNGE